MSTSRQNWKPRASARRPRTLAPASRLRHCWKTELLYPHLETLFPAGSKVCCSKGCATPKVAEMAGSDTWGSESEIGRKASIKLKSYEPFRWGRARDTAQLYCRSYNCEVVSNVFLLTGRLRLFAGS